MTRTDTLKLETRIKLSDPEGNYGTPFRLWINTHVPGIIARYCPDSGANVLDLGCGQGQYVRMLENVGVSGRYLGIDLEERPGWENHQLNGLSVNYRAYDAEKIGDVGETFDFIYAITSFEHFEDDVAALEGMHEVMEPGSSALIVVPSHYSYLNYGTHGFRRYSAGGLRRMAGDAGFEVVELRRIAGFSSFVFHFLWQWPTRLVKYGLKAVVTIPVLGRRSKARATWPRLHYYLDDLMFLHLLTPPGRFLHKTLLHVCAALDRVLPFFEVGYAMVIRK